MKSIEERAAETLQKRIRGSFGYRAAESTLSGFNPEENITIYKSHGGDKVSLESSLDLAIERAEPQVTAAEIAKNLDVDAGEAKTILEEQNLIHTDMVDNRSQYLIQLEKAYDKAEGKYDHLSQFSADNFQRVIDNLVRSARVQYARTKNADWARAVQDVATPVMASVLKLATTANKPSDKVEA